MCSRRSSFLGWPTRREAPWHGLPARVSELNEQDARANEPASSTPGWPGSASQGDVPTEHADHLDWPADIEDRPRLLQIESGRSRRRICWLGSSVAHVGFLGDARGQALFIVYLAARPGLESMCEFPAAMSRQPVDGFPATLTGTLHAAADPHPSTYKTLPWQRIGHKR